MLFCFFCHILMFQACFPSIYVSSFAFLLIFSALPFLSPDHLLPPVFKFISITCTNFLPSNLPYFLHSSAFCPSHFHLLSFIPHVLDFNCIFYISTIQSLLLLQSTLFLSAFLFFVLYVCSLKQCLSTSVPQDESNCVPE